MSPSETGFPEKWILRCAEWAGSCGVLWQALCEGDRGVGVSRLQCISHKCLHRSPGSAGDEL